LPIQNDSDLDILFSCSQAIAYPGASVSAGNAFRAKLVLGERLFAEPTVTEEHGWLVGTLVDAGTMDFTVEGFDRMRRYLNVDMPAYLADLALKKPRPSSTRFATERDKDGTRDHDTR
jgi:hypothetical protein